MTDKTLKIMIIDDEEFIRDSLTLFLESLGHEVSSGEAPVHCDVFKGKDCTHESACVDALLIDQNLPGMNGLECLLTLEKNGCKGLASNILLMSGDTTSLDLDAVSRLGITVVQKPMGLAFLEGWLGIVAAQQESVNGSSQVS